MKKECLTAKYVKSATDEVRRGTSDNITVPRSYMKILVELAYAEAMGGSHNRQVRELVAGLNRLSKMGFYDGN